ncbi:hypothetical protein M3Y97_00135800 [Aphelenchoides bicaudatus]|nr:hypothetical protein M3Y97_00135800 [Aphelenchoides bicaudatus]
MGKKKSKEKLQEVSHPELFRQAIVSKDYEKFITVLRNSTGGNTRATVRDLDVDMILPALNFISEIVQDEKLRGRTAYMRDLRFIVDCMQLLLDTHFGYLSTLRDLDKQLASLVDFARARTSNVEKLSQLDGNISRVLENAKARVSASCSFRDQKEEVFFQDRDGRMNTARKKVTEQKEAEE